MASILSRTMTFELSGMHLVIGLWSGLGSLDACGLGGGSISLPDSSGRLFTNTQIGTHPRSPQEDPLQAVLRSFVQTPRILSDRGPCLFKFLVDRKPGSSSEVWIYNSKSGLGVIDTEVLPVGG